MFKLCKGFKFEAAHRLPHHDGKCQRLHGHSWRGMIICEGEGLAEQGPQQGMLIDYGDMSTAVEGLVEGKLDHYFLNDSLDMESPTSENIAEFCFFWLKPMLPLLKAVIIEETCTSSCEFRP